MQPFRFDLCELPGETEGLRQEIRAFLAEELKQVPKVTRAQTWSGSDPEFKAWEISPKAAVEDDAAHIKWQPVHLAAWSGAAR